jgi:tetraacyldisaccharide 4'-kinase
MTVETRWQTSSAGEEAVARWWKGEYGTSGRILGVLLAPAEVLFRLAVWLRNGAYSAGFFGAAKVPVPVVSVGNLVVGGTGKTPISSWLIDELDRRGHRPALLHGGYADDEPALHRLWHPNTPVFAERDRVESARRAVACGSTVVVVDDGFQYRRLQKDLEILLIAAETWTPHPHLLPRGPWRESPTTALMRADLIVVTRKTGTPMRAQEVMQELAAIAPETPVASVFIRPLGFRRADGAEGRPPGNVLAVAGVAQPELFAENARTVGADVTEVLVFPDHHEYSALDAERIRTTAAGRSVITTAKDHVKLSALLTYTDVWILEQGIEVETGNAAIALALDELAK